VRKALLTLAIACALAVGANNGALASAGKSHNAVLRYEIGPLHAHQSNSAIALWIRNQGGALPHLVLVLDSFHTWKATVAMSKEGQATGKPRGRVTQLSGSRYLWDFGSLPAGRSAYLRLTLRLEKRKAVEINVAAYARAHLSGSPVLASLIPEASRYITLGLPQSG
jgi:hypothetical protein